MFLKIVAGRLAVVERVACSYSLTALSLVHFSGKKFLRIWTPYLIPDNTTVLRRQRGTCQLELGSEILLLIIDRQPLQALFMQLNIQLSKGFGQTIQ